MVEKVRRRASDLRLRFLIAFLALSMLPLVIVTAILARGSLSDLETQSIALESEVAARVATEVEAVIRGRERDLEILDEVAALGSLDVDRQRDLLRGLLSSERMFDELTVVNAEGMETVRVARNRVVAESDLADRASDPAFTSAVVLESTYFGPVLFDADSRLPLTQIAYPLLEPRTGTVDSVLIATISFKPIWELLARFDAPGSGDVYVLSGDGVVVAHKDPTVVLQEMLYTPPASSGRGLGLTGSEAIVAAHVVPLGRQALTVVAEQPLSSALAVVSQASRVTIIVTFLALVAVAVATVVVTRHIVRPIEELAESAQTVEQGDLSHRVAVTGRDEVARLGVAFNRMTSQLQHTVGTLEERVAERTQSLEQATSEQRRLIADLEAKNEQLAAMKAQLEVLVRSKDEFLGSVSHELRTPLSSIVGFAAELRDSHTSFDDDELFEMLDIIATQGEDMADIINDLLVAARAEAGALRVDPKPVDVVEGVRSVVEQLADASVQLCANDASVVAFADGARLRQILRNLVVNAVRYGGAEVCVNVERSGGEVVIEVIDDGEGVPQAEWERIFDAYNSRGNRSPASVGLGLTVSRTLAREMSGDLTYRYEDEQSIFELRLPAAAPSRVAHPAPGARRSEVGDLTLRASG